ncbi:MAG: DNA ligase D [Mariniphaga sp.]|nr:DNA ligase D [Mariniphaga sp.]
MSLDLYKKKRNFANTPEPSASKESKTSKLSFVVQRHYASHLHYDFRLELEGVLKSWAVPKGPSMIAGEKRLAVMVEDHPLLYGKFYGEISEGNYGAGTVEIWDKGNYKPLAEIDNAEKSLLEQLDKGDLKFILNGTHLKGAFALVRMNDGEGKNWLLIKKKDEFALQSYKIDTIEPLKSKHKKKANTVKTATDKPKPVKAVSSKKTSFQDVIPKPMLAKQSRLIIDKAAWFYETKYDGYRVISKIKNSKAELYSRNANSYSKIFQSITDELNSINEEVILDGEVVVEDKSGISDFQLLQNYQSTKQGILKYFVFDILYLNGYDITDFPLLKRKELLGALFENYNFKYIYNTEYQIGGGKKLFEKLSAKGYEGVIAKEPESTYLPGKRADTWLKIKSTMMQEAIICGYTAPQNSRQYFGSIILGIYSGKTLKYIGNCGTGFTEASLKELHAEFEKFETSTTPFSSVPIMNGTKGKPYWIKPELVCNIKFLEWTQDEHLRNPVFMGLRNDKESKEVINESADERRNTNETEREKVITFSGKKVKCTNLNKVYFPGEGYTKGDLITYYQSISKFILPYLKDRPQSLNRHPNGIKGQSFYQKDMDVTQIPAWIKTVKLFSKSNNADIDYLICNDEATLLYMANLGCIEINPWHSIYLKPDEPTYMMLDLDPGEISFVDVVNTALVIKDICDEINIPCYCKTSGATGLHIYIPLAAKYNYDDVKVFAEIMATIVHSRMPDTTSIERNTAKRKDKIYIDFLQNRKGQTIAAPYSVRPRPYATVSAPLMWKEVNHQLTPEMFTIKNMEERLSKTGDLWKPVLQKGIVLTKVIKTIEKL